MNLKAIAEPLVKFGYRSRVLLQKNSPAILVTAGIVGLISGTVLVVKATSKADELLDDAKEQLFRIKEASETFDEEKYSKKDAQKDTALIYTKSGIELVKIYGPGVLLAGASIACIVGSHRILQKRNAVLIMAYNAVREEFSNYRGRVVEDLGIEKDQKYRYGIETQKFDKVEVDEDGKAKKSKEKVEVMDPNSVSIYARFFDESSRCWYKTPEHNLIFLKSQQQYANDMLHARGHLFLNEVYDQLGIPRSQVGQTVGWTIKNDGMSDNFVDFGIFNGNRPITRDFVNGYERSILLDFNVDGVIYDKI